MRQQLNKAHNSIKTKLLSKSSTLILYSALLPPFTAYSCTCIVNYKKKRFTRMYIKLAIIFESEISYFLIHEEDQMPLFQNSGYPILSNGTKNTLKYPLKRSIPPKKESLGYDTKLNQVEEIPVLEICRMSCGITPGSTSTWSCCICYG